MLQIWSLTQGGRAIYSDIDFVYYWEKFIFTSNVGCFSVDASSEAASLAWLSCISSEDARYPAFLAKMLEHGVSCISSEDASLKRRASRTFFTFGVANSGMLMKNNIQLHFTDITAHFITSG